MTAGDRPATPWAGGAMPDREAEKRTAAEAAAELVPDGAKIGLGTGSTVSYLLLALADRAHRLRCVATSPETERRALELGLQVEALDDLGDLDLAIDGADQIDPRGWVIKGGGGAHTREKIVASRARRFVVIAAADKLVDALKPPVPLEVLRFGAQTTLSALAPCRLRDTRASPDGNLIADYLGGVDDPASLARRLADTPGVVDHGLFAPELISEVIVAHRSRVERRRGAKPAPRRAPPNPG